MKGNDCIPVLKALGDETRLRIVRLISDSALTVNTIAEKLEITQYNASKHLKVLREAGLLISSKQGQQRLYSIPENLREQLKGTKGKLELGCCSFRFDQLPK